MNNNLGYTISYKDLQNWIFIPKYYNPEINDELNKLSSTHDLFCIKDLLLNRYISLSSGDEIGKMSYGTGKIPFIRTSDISNWEIKSDPKQGVSENIYNKYANKQDVRKEDIFFVKDGTYLIGQSAFVTKDNLPCLFQSHILKIRINDNSPINSFLFFAILNSTIVKKQIRSKQFTADIIDTIGNRYLELILPVPKNKKFQEQIIYETKKIIVSRNLFREHIRKLPLLAQGVINNINSTFNDSILESNQNIGFLQNASNLVNNIFIPRYYNPDIEKNLGQLFITHNLVKLSDLIAKKLLVWNTGIEVGKLAYGTGQIPFIRTSDISNLELKHDPKQNVSEEIYTKNKQDVQVDDIFVVRDGTYLIGTSCIMTEKDTKILYCGGIFKLRILDKNKLDPYLFLTLLNCPILKKQMKSKQFTRDIIDTLGKRLFEIVLPIPKDNKLREFIAKNMREAIQNRVNFRQRAKEIVI